MKCAYHPELDGVAYCLLCGKALCAPCRREVDKGVYCETCLADIVRRTMREAADDGSPSSPGASPEGAPTRGENPGVAFALGLIPGVGAVYNGDFFKAAAHIAVFAVLIQLTEAAGPDSSALFGLLTAGFYCYMPFEAYYTAKKRSLLTAGIDLETPIDRLHRQLGTIRNLELWGGIGMVAVGVVFLADSLDVLALSRIARYWPVLLIVYGAWLVFVRVRRRGVSEAEAGASPPVEPGSREQRSDA